MANVLCSLPPTVFIIANDDVEGAITREDLSRGGLMWELAFAYNGGGHGVDILGTIESTVPGFCEQCLVFGGLAYVII